MGREIRRVPERFDWPLNKVWEGFLWPKSLDSLPCPNAECQNGQTPAGAWVNTMAQMLLMLDGDRREQAMGRPMHPYFTSVPGAGHFGQIPRPSADIVEFGTGLAGREAGFIGHDAIDNWTAFDKLRTAAGLPDTWGQCPDCAGHAYVEAYPGQRADQEKWEQTQPPTGDWWQLWETVSEGSPVTPAFATAEELAQYLVENPTVTGPGARGMTFEQAMRFIAAGWAPSGIISAAGMQLGVEAIGNGSIAGTN